MISIHLPSLQRLSVRLIMAAAEIYVLVRVAVFRLSIGTGRLQLRLYSMGFHASYVLHGARAN